MKNFIKSALILVFSITLFSSCSNEDDFDIPPFRPLLFSEDFPNANINYNENFDFPGWTNFAEAGTKLWIERAFNGDGYIQFSPFGSGQVSNIGWAITPAINLDSTDGEVLTFSSASNFVDNPDNKLQVLISSNFDGTNVLAATWILLPATVANETTNGYIYIPSGEIDLSSYSGNIHIAFKVFGGSGSTMDGLYQVDKIKVYEK